MEDTKLIAKKGFGGEYECQQAWPEDTFVQCGDSGLVLGNAQNESYITAFFEAFPKNPSTFIRGEGKDLPEAELNAFKKFQNIKGCDEHDYTRHGTSEHANCTKCGLFTSHYFEPTHKCSVCSKENVNYQMSDEQFKVTYFCRDHYLEKAMTFVSDYDIDNIPEYAGMSSEYEHNKYVLRDMYFTQLSLKYKLVDANDDEYKINNILDKKQRDFDHHCRVRIHKLHYALNELRPEGEKFVIATIMFNKMYQHLFLAPELYEELFKEFYNIERDKDIEQDLIAFHSKMYERYRRK
jgi:hypothetical protein